MFRWLLALAFALALFGPGLGDGSGFARPAYAESYVSDPGPSKGVIGQDGVKCVGEASHNGDTYTMIYYIGADREEMAGNPEREKAWQRGECHDYLSHHMTEWIRVGYDGGYCLLWHPAARNPGVDEPRDLYCYTMPAAPDFDGSKIRETVTGV